MRFPWSPRRDSVIGIDLGTSVLKLVLLAKRGDGYEVQAQAIAPVPRDTIVENEVLDSAVFTDTLASLLDDAGVRPSRVAIAIGGSALFNKTIQLPYAEEFDLEPEIENIAGEHVPFPMDDVYLDFAIQGVNEDNPELMDVVLVACKRDLVDDLQLLLLDAGLELAVVDCAVYALQNAASLLLGVSESQEEEDADESDDESEEGAVALVNVGAHMTNVNIVFKGRSLFVRDHYFGAGRLTQMINEELGCGFLKAEQAKLAGDIPDSLRDSFFDELESEVMRSLDFFSSLFPDHSVDKVMVTGGGALLSGLVEALRERLSMDVELLDLSSLLHDAEDRPLLGGPRMTVAVGLALRTFDEGNA